MFHGVELNEVRIFTKIPTCCPRHSGPINIDSKNHETFMIWAQMGFWTHWKCTSIVFQIQREIAVVPRMRTPEHIGENFRLWNWRLSDSDMAEIQALNKDNRLYLPLIEGQPWCSDHPLYPFKINSVWSICKNEIEREDTLYQMDFFLPFWAFFASLKFLKSFSSGNTGFSTV